jgi:hypothetical protein
MLPSSKAPKAARSRTSWLVRLQNAFRRPVKLNHYFCRAARAQFLLPVEPGVHQHPGPKRRLLRTRQRFDGRSSSSLYGRSTKPVS